MNPENFGYPQTFTTTNKFDSTVYSWLAIPQKILILYKKKSNFSNCIAFKKKLTYSYPWWINIGMNLYIDQDTNDVWFWELI